MNGRFRIPGAKSGALHFWFVVLALVGGLTGAAHVRHEMTTPEVGHHEECDPIVHRMDTDQAAWDLLIDNGYTEAGDPPRLYPPGCEGAAQ